MGRTTRRLVIILALTTTVLSAQTAERKTYADPARFDAAIAAFETADSLAPTTGGIHRLHG
jgi:hypothetical protein